MIFITVNIFKHTAKKIRNLNEQITSYLKCMVPLKCLSVCRYVKIMKLITCHNYKAATMTRLKKSVNIKGICVCICCKLHLFSCTIMPTSHQVKPVTLITLIQWWFIPLLMDQSNKCHQWRRFISSLFTHRFHYRNVQYYSTETILMDVTCK